MQIFLEYFQSIFVIIKAYLNYFQDETCQDLMFEAAGESIAILNFRLHSQNGPSQMVDPIGVPVSFSDCQSCCFRHYTQTGHSNEVGEEILISIKTCCKWWPAVTGVSLLLMAKSVEHLCLHFFLRLLHSAEKFHILAKVSHLGWCPSSEGRHVEVSRNCFQKRRSGQAIEPLRRLLHTLLYHWLWK